MIRVILLILILIPSLSWGVTETFYLCNGGDGSLPETDACATAWDASDFNTAGNWDSGVDANDGKIGANDTVILKNDGGNYNAQFTIQGSGASGKQITLQGEDGETLPIIDGEDTRNLGIFADGKNYITIQNLDIRNNLIYQIKFLDGQNIIVEKNIMTGPTATSHGVGVFTENADGYACSAIVRYNYCYDSGDDCYYTMGCTTLNAVKFHGNGCFDTGDDCFDIDSTATGKNPSSAYVANNTFYDFRSAAIDVQGGNAVLKAINNIMVQEQSTSPACDGDGNVGRCFVYMNTWSGQDPDPSDHTFQNNIYYAPTDPGETLDTFFIDFAGSVSCDNDPALCVTYTEWAARGDVSESGSSYADPLIDLNLYLVTKQGSPAEHTGQDNCSDIEGVLEVGSTWTDDNVTVFSSTCNTGNEQNIGAYGTRGECPVSMKY